VEAGFSFVSKEKKQKKIDCRWAWVLAGDCVRLVCSEKAGRLMLRFGVRWD
jgi:hypothetical protein